MPKKKIEEISPAEVALNGMKKMRRDLDLQIAALEASIPSRNSGRSTGKNFKVFDPAPILRKMGKI